jgi:hypothetical protein
MNVPLAVTSFESETLKKGMRIAHTPKQSKSEMQQSRQSYELLLEMKDW